MLISNKLRLTPFFSWPTLIQCTMYKGLKASDIHKINNNVDFIFTGNNEISIFLNLIIIKFGLLSKVCISPNFEMYLCKNYEM